MTVESLLGFGIMQQCPYGAILRIILLAILLYAEISVGATLIYWCATNPDEIELANRLVKEWNHSHSETTIRLQHIPAMKN